MLKTNFILLVLLLFLQISCSNESNHGCSVTTEIAQLPWLTKIINNGNTIYINGTTCNINKGATITEFTYNNSIVFDFINVGANAVTCNQAAFDCQGNQITMTAGLTSFLTNSPNGKLIWQK